MESIPSTKNASLYNLDCSYLTDVRYHRKDLESIVIIFSEKPSGLFPDQFFLMPEGPAYDYRAFIFSLTEAVHLYQPPEGEACYIAHAVTNDIPEVRQNFRVYVTFQVPVLLEGQKKETTVTVKDIGTGGFQFISKQRFEPDTMLTTMFTHIKTPVCITARIQKMRPVRKSGVYGYGCQFTDLSPNAETLIRNFVFQTEALQAKAKREKQGALE